MQVSTAVLLETTTRAIERYEKARVTYDEGVRLWKAQNRKRLTEKALERQKRARDALSVGLKAKKPLTVDQLRDALGGRSYISDLGVERAGDPPRRFTVNLTDYTRPDGVPLADLKALKSLLESVEETTISDGQLQRLGFKNLGWIFRAAVTNEAADGQ